MTLFILCNLCQFLFCFVVCYLNSPNLRFAHEVKWGCSDVDGLADIPRRGQVASWQKMLLIRICYICWGAQPAWLSQQRLLHKPKVFPVPVPGIWLWQWYIQVLIATALCMPGLWSVLWSISRPLICLINVHTCLTDHHKATVVTCWGLPMLAFLTFASKISIKSSSIFCTAVSYHISQWFPNSVAKIHAKRSV